MTLFCFKQPACTVKHPFPKVATVFFTSLTTSRLSTATGLIPEYMVNRNVLETYIIPCEHSYVNVYGIILRIFKSVHISN